MANMEYSVASQVSCDMDRIRFARFLADLLDRRFTIPGTSIRIGLDPIISLIPGIGDLLANLAGSLILVIAAQLGVPKIILLRMGINIATNALIGIIPVFGDVLSIWFRSNVKNVQLLERYLDGESRRALAGDWALVILLLVGLIALLGGLVVAALWLFKQLWNVL